jgi:hypothetical protein
MGIEWLLLLLLSAAIVKAVLRAADIAGADGAAHAADMLQVELAIFGGGLLTNGK